MIYILGECHGNCLLASRIYKQRYPDEITPQPITFKRVKERFESTGDVKYRKKNRSRVVTHEENELSVLLSVEENPHCSIRRISNHLDISKTSVNRILRRHKFHPYHLELHHDLHGDDFQHRVEFCRIMLHKVNENPQFISTVLFSDEATFKNNGSVNRHNMHYYSVVNPRWTRHINYQNQWSINVWGGILGNSVVGPFFFDEHLTGEMYKLFLENNLPELLEEIDLDTRQQMWYQHDGAPPHFRQDVRNFLNNSFPERWIGRRGPIHWPARSPDLTPLDFFCGVM